ncbi:uncharacterized protein LOC106177047 isoform X2 [Lingula anatina]|uniref:Uncharacterized protein LOC106177047 isoform X2 n=1 Tax=Lingula anatina TaxID=7574 RepID=A0A2R2MPV0_LINAN|nr:uncharacterized protein LOC106177047 isoform X2 [Lingula anatina]|eukprot:XP_023932265.1 uncharacterized protein LOC106177047 isoform X2 [Lingula anatina]
MDLLRVFCAVVLLTAGDSQDSQQANNRVFSMSLSGRFKNFYKSSDMLAMLRNFEHEDCLSRTDFQKHFEGMQALQFFYDQYKIDFRDIVPRVLFEGSVRKKGLEFRRLLWPHTAKHQLDAETHGLRVRGFNNTYVTMAQWRVTVLNGRFRSNANYTGVLKKGDYVAVGEYCVKTPGGFADKVMVRFSTKEPVTPQKNGKSIIKMKVTGSEVRDMMVIHLGNGHAEETQLWKKGNGKIIGSTTIVFP